MKVLLLGKNGQIGWELQRSLSTVGELIALDRAGSHGYCGDLADLEGLRKTIRAIQPSVIVNAGAYTAVDAAETDWEQAQLINSTVPHLLATEMDRIGGCLVHYSTDYVFDGSGETPWVETDRVGPLNKYGLSKLQGEEAIVATGCKHLILRTSWVYGARGNNFAKTMLRLAQQRDHLTVIADQFGAPTGAELLADATALALRMMMSDPSMGGIYHLAAAGETSWYDYARFIIEEAKRKGLQLATNSIEPIPASAYPTAAMRPANSRLDTKKIRKNFDLHLPHWKDGVVRTLSEIIGNKP